MDKLSIDCNLLKNKDIIWRQGESNYASLVILRNLLIFRRRRNDENG
jgi:hypothetical protein